METLFKGMTVVTMGPEGVINNAFVGVDSGKICWVGAREPDERADRTVDASGKVMMPGLINCHTHLPMAFLRGYSDDCPLQSWLYDYIFPAEAKLDDRAVEICARAGIAEALSFGTTSVSDMYGHLDSVFKAAAEAGIKLNGSNGSIYLGDESDFGFETCPDMVNMRDMHEKWHGHDGGRLKVDASVHAVYTSSYPLWDAVAEYAINNGLRLHVHVSETRTEHEECLEKYGLTPAQLLDCHNVWKTGGIAAHGVWLTREDMSLLAKRGVSVAHNPVSNQKLGSGYADVRVMSEAGVNVALGTDSVASNNNLDMFEEMKAAAIMAKNLRNDPTAVTAHQALLMATVNGAEAQGRQSECGTIETGKDADLILLDFDKPHLTPCHSAESGLVYAAKGSDVVMTMVRGKVLYENGRFLTLDWDKTRYELEHCVLPMIFGDRG